MPPLPPRIGYATLVELISKAKSGVYHLEISDFGKPFFAPEGGVYFEIEDRVLVIWEPKDDRA